VLLSKYSDNVIGAGEFWLSKSGDLKVNENSGSYMSGTNMVKAIVEVFRLVFPGIEIHYTPTSERPDNESSEVESEAGLSWFLMRLTTIRLLMCFPWGRD
jgi:hypothetical protein